jgi:hypothetical protein
LRRNVLIGRRFSGEVRSKGFEQGDVWKTTHLWNEENQRMAVIDFERAASTVTK